MEYEYNIIVPVTVIADSPTQAEVNIINNLTKLVIDNKEKVTLRWVGQRSNLA
jgi:hypothetical protein